MTVSEIIRGVSMAQGTVEGSACASFDADGSGRVSVDELVRAVNAALSGCRQLLTPTGTLTPTPSPEPSPSNMPSSTLTETGTPSPTPTESPTYPVQATETPSAAPIFSATPPPTDTATVGNTATATPTRFGAISTFTQVLTFTPVFSFTPIPPSTPTTTSTATETATATTTPTLTCPPTASAATVLARQNVPAGGYAFSGAEIELEHLATTVEIQSECDEISAIAVLRAASARSECQRPGCTVRVRLSTDGAPDVVQTFGIGDVNHLTLMEMDTSYTNLTAGAHTFRVFISPYGDTFLPTGYLEISKR